MGTGGLFPGVTRGRGVTLTTHSHLLPRSRMRSCTFLPLGACMGSGTASMTGSDRGRPPCSCSDAARCQWSLDQPVHVSGFVGQDLGVLQLDAMSPADAVFSYLSG
jgi:hypothetical protein